MKDNFPIFRWIHTSGVFVCFGIFLIIFGILGGLIWGFSENELRGFWIFEHTASIWTEWSYMLLFGSLFSLIGVAGCIISVRDEKETSGLKALKEENSLHKKNQYIDNLAIFFEEVSNYIEKLFAQLSNIAKKLYPPVSKIFLFYSPSVFLYILGKLFNLRILIFLSLVWLILISVAAFLNFKKNTQAKNIKQSDD